MPRLDCPSVSAEILKTREVLGLMLSVSSGMALGKEGAEAMLQGLKIGEEIFTILFWGVL